MKKRFVSLLSGGIDSPVAAYKAMKKGCEVVFVHFHNNTQQSSEVKNKVVELTRILSKHQKRTKLYMVPFLEVQKEIIKAVPAKYRMIIYRRMMFRIGEGIAKKEKACGFVTGDSLGQVASQTLSNISVIYKATKKPVITPLLGWDKVDTVREARKIGTYEESIKPYSDCCTFFIAKHPETRADIDVIEKLEKNLKIKKIAKKAEANAEVINL